jgi:hypothetical protein
LVTRARELVAVRYRLPGFADVAGRSHYHERMHRNVVGLLAASAATVAVLAALAHGDLFLAAAAGLASGLGVYLSLPPKNDRFRTTPARLVVNARTRLHG